MSACFHVEYWKCRNLEKKIREQVALIFTTDPFSYVSAQRPQRQNLIDIHARSTPLYQLLGLNISKPTLDFSTT